MTYDELVALVKAYSDRYDAEVADNIDNFMRLAEMRISRLLRVRDMTARAKIATEDDAEYYPLPLDFAGIRDIELQDNGSRYTMSYANPEQMNSLHSGADSVSGYYYTIVANQLHVKPEQPAGKFIELVYYQTVPALTSSNFFNWVSLYHAELYLSGMMIEVQSFVKNAEGMKLWSERFNAAANELSVTDQNDRWSGTPLQVRTG